jgi:hypothetical protein
VLFVASSIFKGCFSRREKCEGDCDGLRIVGLCCGPKSLVVCFASIRCVGMFAVVRIFREISSRGRSAKLLCRLNDV